MEAIFSRPQCNNAVQVYVVLVNIEPSVYTQKVAYLFN